MTSRLNARAWGVAGSLTLLVGMIALRGTPAQGPVALSGAILVLFAVKQVADRASAPSIFRNCLVSFALHAGAAGALLAFSSGAAAAALSGLGAAFGFLQAGLVVAWLLLVAGAFFLWRSFGAIRQKTGVKLFAAAGVVYLVGAVSVAVVVGFVAILAACVLQAIAFLRLPGEPPAAPVTGT